MKASVVLMTFWTEGTGPERLANLRRVIGGFYQQTETDFELVLVVDGPPDNPTLRYLRGVQRRAKFPVRIYSRPKEGIRIASARNVGVQAAQASVIIGSQDNVLPGPEFVAAHLEYHANDLMGPVFVIGLACRDPNDLSTDHRYDRGFCTPRPWFDAWGRNFSVPTEAIRAAGGCDEAFDGAWGHEDVELAYRLYLQGVTFVYATDPEIVTTYLVNQELPKTPESLRRQAEIFYKKHGFWI